ncbi:hypothetical protein [Stutzerimonas stutzeri]|jgi:hypothetical protein|uniref:Lipoprotein n=1 Tax=Stutzerimonas stutzeri TaxID=316 RepID=A0A0D9AZZ8_STUST|nr:hypothetical protein [Stutzerimonas stutzeri]KJH84916.1 hypothetical protein UF78_01465 [Stutzerimonas stutzeri]
MSRLVALAIAFVLLSGCAYGRKADYAHSYPTLSAAPIQAVEVQVTDARPYVLSGNKKGTFVGLVRGSYYIPYDVNTRSGLPLAEDLQAALVGGFERKGVSTHLAEADARKASKSETLLLAVFVHEWKSEAAFGEILTYSLRAELIDQSGQRLATAQASGSDRVYDYTQAGQAALASLLAQPTLMQVFGGDAVTDTAQDEPVQIAPVRKAAAELYIPGFGRDGVY